MTRFSAEFIERTRDGQAGDDQKPDRLLAGLLRAHYDDALSPLPLSASEITYLNEAIFIGDHRFPLSRATLYFLAEPEPRRPMLDLTCEEGYEALVAWWVFDKLATLKAQDCLIPDAYRRVLMRDRRPGAHPDFSLPAFMGYLWQDDPIWKPLLAWPDTSLPLLHARALLAALERPFLLRLIPQRELMKLLDLWEALGTPDAPSLSPARSFPGRTKLNALLASHGCSLNDPVPRSLSKDGHRARCFALPKPEKSAVIDCQVIGPLDRASGLGQSSRLVLEGLRQLPITVNGHAFTLGNPQPLASDLATGLAPAANPLCHARTNIFHLNPDQLPLALTQMPDIFVDTHKIGFFYWELDRPAPGDALALQLVDEIWVATEFCASIYQGCSKPVRVVGLPLVAPPALVRAEAERVIASYLPARPGIRTVLAVYDSLSWIERKNPRLALDVFQEAFAGRSDVRFVIKTHNLERIADLRQRQVWQLVQERALADSRIVILDETMTSEAMGALIATSDVFLSLHRAEGLGLGLIEAMQRGVAVVATDYSGNRDFCNPVTAWPVAYRLVPAQRGDYAYADGQMLWAEPNKDDAVMQLRAALEGSDRAQRIVAAKAQLSENWSVSAFGTRALPSLQGVMPSQLLR